MIRCNLTCGLGNQLFMYAYARALSEEFNDKTIVLNRLFGKMAKIVTFGRLNIPEELNNFYLNENVVVAKNSLKNFVLTAIELAYFCTYHQNVIKRKFNQEVFERNSERGIYMQGYRLEHTYYAHSKKTKKNKVVMDFFMSELYFKNIKEILMRELKVKTPPSPQNAEMIKELNSCNSVGVHIRRGDILKPEFRRYKVCNEDYYLRGMDYVAQHTENPVFYVFSNDSGDLNWIKEHYHFKYPVKYVDLHNPGYEDFRLLYNCKHFVLSSSTYSWWGSYLSENKDKIIIVPSRWRNTPYEGKLDIIRDDMIPIDVNLDGSD